MTFSQIAHQHPFGLGSLALGTMALMMVSIVMFAGPFAPQQNSGITLGELAAGIRSIATGETTATATSAQPRGWDIDRTLQLIIPVLAVLSIAMAVIAKLRHEPGQLAKWSVAIGVAALVVQFLWWLALLIAGIVLLVSMFENFESFFS